MRNIFAITIATLLLLFPTGCSSRQLPITDTDFSNDTQDITDNNTQNNMGGTEFDQDLKSGLEAESGDESVPNNENVSVENDMDLESNSDIDGDVKIAFPEGSDSEQTAGNRRVNELSYDGVSIVFGDTAINLENPLDPGDVKSLDLNDLAILRNAYYARHGFIFDTHYYTGYFLRYDWYKPDSKNIEGKLTDTDWENIKIVKAAEANPLAIQYEQLYPVVNSQGKWGYIDFQGNVVIDYKYDSADFFIRDTTIVTINDECALIGLDGRFIIKPVDYITIGGDGWYNIRIKDGNEYIYGIADEHGKIYYNKKFEKREAFFNDGLTPFVDNGRYGYMNAVGDIIIEPQYSYAYGFCEGLAAVVNDDDKYGYIDETGKLVIPFRFEHDPICTYTHQAFWNEIAIVVVDGKYGCIDKKGNYIVEPVFDYADDFSEGLALVEKGGLYGYIDTKGNYVIEPQFALASPFSDGYAYAMPVDDKNDPDDGNGYYSGMIDRTGKFIIPPIIVYELDTGEYTFRSFWTTGFIDGLARVQLYDEKNGLLLAYINKKGDAVWTMDYIP